MEQESIIIQKKIEQSNFISKVKWLFGSVIKQTIYYDNEIFEVLLTEDEYRNPAKIELKYRQLWLKDTGNKQLKVVNLNKYKNVFELLFFNKLTKNDLIRLLKTVWNRYVADISSLKWYVENLPYPNHIKTALLEQHSLFHALRKYQFAWKESLLKKLESLETRETIERWKEYIEIAKELELENEMARKIKSALVEPALYFIIIIAIIIFFNERFFPVLLELWKTNPAVVWKITSNPLYVLYNWVKDNYILIIIVSILSVVVFNILKSIKMIRKYYQQMLLWLPIFKNILQYKELSRLISVLITYYKYRVSQALFYTYLSNWLLLYKEKFYTREKSVLPKNIIQEMLEKRYMPPEEWANLLSIMATDPYNHVDKMILLKEETLKRYEESVQAFLKLIRYVILFVIFGIVGLIINASYGTIYSIISNFI